MEKGFCWVGLFFSGATFFRFLGVKNWLKNFSFPFKYLKGRG